MLLLTYSYVVPKDKRTEHARLLHRMRQVMARLGLDHFEAYEQVGKNWSGGDATGRVVQILRFRDKAHFAAIQAAEKSDPGAQQLIREFCELVNLPYQQQTGIFADGYYASLIAAATARPPAVLLPQQAPAPLTAQPQDVVPPAGEELSPDEGEEAEDRQAQPSPDDTAMPFPPDEAPDDVPENRGQVEDEPRDVNGDPDVLDYLNEPAAGSSDDAGTGEESRR